MANEIDKKSDEDLKKIADEYAETSGFKKLLKYNEPKILIFIAVFMSAISGAS